MTALAIGIVTAAVPTEQDVTAGDRLATVRESMGGARELGAVKSAIFTGQEKFLNAGLSMGGVNTPKYTILRVETRLLLPDHYLRRFTTDSGMDRRVGLLGTKMLDGTPGKVEWQRENLGRLLFSVFLHTETIYPFILKELKGNTLRFTGPDGSDVLLDVDPASHLPRRLSYSSDVQATAASVAGKKQKVVIEFGDFREVGVLRLPHKLLEHVESDLRRAAREITFDRIEINPTLSHADFQR